MGFLAELEFELRALVLANQVLYQLIHTLPRLA
jgi:hypothetical protein